MRISDLSSDVCSSDLLNEDWRLSVNANFTTIDNEVLELVNEGYEIFNGISRTAIGYPVGNYYGYVSDGIYQTATEIRQSRSEECSVGNASVSKGRSGWQPDH